ncbi:MAG: RNA polymerase sigma factor, partial [Acidobacteriota bacterium]
RTVQEPLYRYLLRLLSDSALAEDVLQDVFLLIYRKLRWLRDPGLFRSWAYRIASREAFRSLKKERRWRQSLHEQDALQHLAAPSGAEPGTELIDQLPQLAQKVSPASRAVLILHYLHGMTLQEAADVLGVGLGTAKSRLAYGLKSLRKAVESPVRQDKTCTRRTL